MLEIVTLFDLVSVVTIIGMQGVILYLLLENRDLRAAFRTPDVLDEVAVYEEEQLEKKIAFDKRINEIKDELAREQVAKRTGQTADELHPEVKNLPHNSIIDYQRLPDVEYAE